ncbi:kinase-like domain-containing protein, partial [Ephemerocybe angulata]
MAVNCLSPHPSNPLEVGSSDVFNKAYKAQLGIGVEIHSDRLSEFVGGYASDSDDPLREIPKMEEYQSHIAEVTGFKAEDTRYIDLDEGMSDDELQEGYGQDDTPRAARTRRAMRYILEDEEDGGEEMEEVEENEGEGEGQGGVRHIFDDDEDVVDGQGLDIDEDMEDWGGVEDEEQEQYDDDDEQENDEEHDDLDVHPTSDDIDCFALDESEEEATLKLKPIDEQLEIQHEIQDFKNAVPMLGDDYKLIDRLGTGTFSSVYKAIDLRYHEWDNSPWLGHHPPASSAHYQSVPKPPGSRVFVAIKRIYVTSGPERIKNELLLMELCRGCRHVSQLITAFRHEDQVAIVMPYHRNEDFREYFMELPMPGIKEYFRCLLRALRDIHARHIIHRDVKPANFLFDPRTGQGSLCDFGLAQRFDSKAPAHGACLHTTMSKDDAHGKYRTKSEYNSDWVRSQQVAARKKSKTRAEFHAPRGTFP